MKNNQKILIKQGYLAGKIVDLLITGNKIVKVSSKIEQTEVGDKSDKDQLKIIQAKDKAIIPSFVNGHNHAAMTLFRGYADDLPLEKWLKEKIWPLEKKLTQEDVYWGAKLACLEMIKSGTTFFNDMYWHFEGTAKAVEEMGIRANIAWVAVDLNDPKKGKAQIKKMEELYVKNKNLGKRIKFILGPHSIYAVSKETLKWVREFSQKKDLMIHIHVSETLAEVKECLRKFGKRPVEYLESIGFLSPRVVMAHAVWLNEKELAICQKHDVRLVYNPISNMKLVSGTSFPYREIKKRGIKLAFGTDGCASSNNLDIFEVMKIACLIQKSQQKDFEILSSQEAFEIATKGGAAVFNLNSGEIKEGKLADLLLVDLNLPELTPNHNLISNLVYSANGSCVDTLICNGKVLMENRKVVGEEDILVNTAKVAAKITNF